MSRSIGWMGLALLALAGCGGPGAPAAVDAGHDAARDDASTSDASPEIDASSGSIGSCDLRTAGGYCQEYDAPPAVLAVVHGSCDDNDGTWADEACPRAGALGGCAKTDATFGETTNWFYVGGPYATAADVMTVCAADEDAHYVAP